MHQPTEVGMLRFKAVLSASLIAAVLLVGPGGGTAAAGTNFLSAGWVCHPHGTSGEAPSTTLSAASIDFGTPGRSVITCLFRNLGIGGSGSRFGIIGGFGGPCTFQNDLFRVDFQHRLYLVFGATATLQCWGGLITLKSDLSITKSDGVTTVLSGGSTTYTIVVSNAGPGAATGAQVGDTFPAAITGNSWTAVGSGGASGFSASGTGPIADIVNLPSGATITYTVGASISASATGTMTNTATVTPAAGTIDPDSGNNSASDTDTVAVPRTLTTTASNFNGRDTRLFDLVSYGTTQCADLPEDGTTTCAETVADGTVVTVDLQDESFFTYTCPGASEQNAAGTGPYTGQCIVTMDANKQVSILADAIAP